MNKTSIYSLNYYTKNKDKINEKRRANYGDKERSMAKIRQLRYIERHKSEKQLKPKKRHGLSYYDWKKQYPGEYRVFIEYINEKRRERYKNDPEYRKNEIKRCVRNSICRIHNSRVGGIKLTKEVIDKLYKKYNNTCVFCKRTKEETKLSIDHIKSIKLGGTNDFDNLQILCLDCNRKKSWK